MQQPLYLALPDELERTIVDGIAPFAKDTAPFALLEVCYIPKQATGLAPQETTIPVIISERMAATVRNPSAFLTQLAAQYAQAIELASQDDELTEVFGNMDSVIIHAATFDGAHSETVVGVLTRS